MQVGIYLPLAASGLSEMEIRAEEVPGEILSMPNTANIASTHPQQWHLSRKGVPRTHPRFRRGGLDAHPRQERSNWHTERLDLRVGRTADPLRCRLRVGMKPTPTEGCCCFFSLNCTFPLALVLRGGVACLLLIGFLLLLVGQSSVAFASTGLTGSEPTLNLQIDLDGTTKVGYWLPVQAQLGNAGASFRGTLVVRTYSGPPRSAGRITALSSWSFEEPVSLPHGAQQQINLSVPYTLSPSDPQGVVAMLLDQRGKTIATQTQTVFTLKPGDLFVGILSDQQSGFDPLSIVSLPNQFDSLTLTNLDASTMPTSAAVLQNFDVLILDDFNTSTLSASQRIALQTWINDGGVLIDVGGPDWQRTLGTLPPALLPVTVDGSSTLPAGTPLIPVGSDDAQASGQKPAPTALQTSIPISTATLRSGQNATFDRESILSSGDTPLIVQAREGQGVIYYLAFDPAREPFSGWQSTSTLWHDLFFRALADRLLISNAAPTYATGPAQLLARGGIMQMLYPDARLALWTIGLLLACYLLVLGPVCYLLMRRNKRSNWGWRVMLGSIVVFSLLSYGLASYERGTSLVNNSISIIQLNQGSSSAHITTYMGVFVPNAGDYRVQIPGNVLAQPVSNLLTSSRAFLANNDPPTIITPQSQDTTITLSQNEPWTFQPIVAEQDRQLAGGITANLALRNNALVGTISNTLKTSLSDVYVLLPLGFIAIGSLPAGATQQINIPVQSAASSNTLADAIAKSGGLSASYFPYAQGGQPQSDFQRHIALLSALSGIGFDVLPCAGMCSHPLINKQVLVTPQGAPSGTLPQSGNDPLLATGTTATLIGWADTPLDGQDAVSINGSSPQGFHDNLIEMPLDITLATPSRIPPDYLPGQLIDAQGSDVQTVQPSVYTTATGNLTFEFTLPNDSPSPAGLTITIPNRLSSTLLSNTNNAQASLYNWRSATWDALSPASQNTFTVANAAAYIDPGGRILVRVANQGASSAKLVLARPSLSLQG